MFKTFNTLDYTKEYITVQSGEKRTYLDQQSLSKDMVRFKRRIRKSGMTPKVETLLNVIKITGVKK